MMPFHDKYLINEMMSPMGAAPDPYSVNDEFMQMLRAAAGGRSGVYGDIGGQADLLAGQTKATLSNFGMATSPADFLLGGPSALEYGRTFAQPDIDRARSLEKLSYQQLGDITRDEDRITEMVRSSIKDAQSSETLTMRRQENELRMKEFEKKVERGNYSNLQTFTDPSTGKRVLGRVNLETNQIETVEGDLIPYDKSTTRVQGTTGSEVYVDPKTNERYVLRSTGRTSEYVSATTGKQMTDKDVARRLIPEEVSQAEGKAAGREVGKGTGKAETKMLDLAGESAENLRTINELEQTLSGLSTGAISGNRFFTTAASVWKQATGKDPGDITTREQANSLIRRLVLNERAKMQGQGTITDQEQRMIEAALPNLGSSPEANRVILDILRRANQRAISKSKSWRSMPQGTDYRTWEGNWNERNVKDVPTGGQGAGPLGLSRGGGSSNPLGLVR